MYHDVVDGGDADLTGLPGAAAAVYKLSRAAFERHLEAIAATGLLPQMASHGRWESSHPLFLTFDDGGVSAVDVIAPLLEQRGWHGHFFITTDYIGQPGFLSARQVRELAARGHIVGSHSASHPTRMSYLGRSELFREWSSSRARLEDIVGARVETASVPGGYYSRTVGETAAEAGYKVLFYSEPTERVRRIAGCWLLGRYYLKRHMNESAASGFATGRWWHCWKQTAYWNVKKAAKWAAPGLYLKLWRTMQGQP